MKLKPKHYLFIAHIIRGESATQAAINAGYSKANAHNSGSNLLKNTDVKRELEKQINTAGLTPERIIQELYDLYEEAKANGSYGPAKDIMQLIARHNGMFQDLRKVEHKHSHEFEQLLSATRLTKDVTPPIPLIQEVQHV